jgi:putative sigma-54 modulation protein
MKVTYTGKLEELSPGSQRKLERKYAKLAKLLDKRQGEREAHVILTSEKNMRQAEITVVFADHRLVGIASAADQFGALTAAIDKLDKQILKLHDKRIATKRNNTAKVAATAPALEEQEAVEAEAAATAPLAEVVRVNSFESRKPMTLEEALLEIEDDRDFVVYRDADTDRVSVLLRRRDGGFALVEA